MNGGRTRVGVGLGKGCGGSSTRLGEVYTRSTENRRDGARSSHRVGRTRQDSRRSRDRARGQGHCAHRVAECADVQRAAIDGHCTAGKCIRDAVRQCSCRDRGRSRVGVRSRECQRSISLLGESTAGAADQAAKILTGGITHRQSVRSKQQTAARSSTTRERTDRFTAIELKVSP